MTKLWVSAFRDVSGIGKSSLVPGATYVALWYPLMIEKIPFSIVKPIEELSDVLTIIQKSQLPLSQKKQSSKNLVIKLLILLLILHMQ